MEGAQSTIRWETLGRAEVFPPSYTARDYLTSHDAHNEEHCPSFVPRFLICLHVLWHERPRQHNYASLVMAPAYFPSSTEWRLLITRQASHRAKPEAALLTPA